MKDEVPEKLLGHFRPILGKMEVEELDTLLTLLKKMRRALDDEEVRG